MATRHDHHDTRAIEVVVPCAARLHMSVPTYKKLKTFAFGAAILIMTLVGIAAGGNPTYITPMGVAGMILIGGWELSEYFAIRDELASGGDKSE
jgi:hypothetical protein